MDFASTTMLSSAGHKAYPVGAKTTQIAETYSLVKDCLLAEEQEAITMKGFSKRSS